MNDIPILDKFPIILTKDKSYNPIGIVKEGSFILLPDDAVLVIVGDK